MLEEAIFFYLFKGLSDYLTSLNLHSFTTLCNLINLLESLKMDVLGKGIEKHDHKFFEEMEMKHMSRNVWEDPFNPRSDNLDLPADERDGLIVEGSEVSPLYWSSMMACFVQEMVGMEEVEASGSQAPLRVLKHTFG